MWDKFVNYANSNPGKALLLGLVIAIFVIVLLALGASAWAAVKTVALSENFDQQASINGGGLYWRAANALTSGASMRNAGEFSQPNQGNRTSLYNADIATTAALLGLPPSSEIKQGQRDIAAVRAATASSVNPNLPATQTTMTSAVATLPAAAGSSPAAVAGAAQAAAAAAAEYLVSDRYGPEFLESSSDELAQFQADLPPLEYSVVSGETKRFTGGESAAASEYFANLEASKFRDIGVGMPY